VNVAKNTSSNVKEREYFYLKSLNKPQLEAVKSLLGPLLILAGAGTGKTRVLITRLAHILVTRCALPSEILAVTFTNKAAMEMKDRVEKLIRRSTETMWIGTFHSLCARILRKHAEIVNLKSNFTILDADDQIRLIKQVMEIKNLDLKRWPPRSMLAIIERWKDKGLSPPDIGRKDIGKFASGKSLDIYKAYQERLITLNSADFGDLILHCLRIFKKSQDILSEYQRKFKFILVDEYQDTNIAQNLWLKKIALGRNNICCVGDDDQSIYAWRGAEVDNILHFSKDFSSAKTIRLEENYRSTGHILSSASGLISHNKSRLGKTLWTSTDGGEKINIKSFWNGKSEAISVSEEIERLQARKSKLSEISILLRSSFQMREFEDRLGKIGIPYRIVGGPRFYERMEIRDAVAYFRVILQPLDDLALERIINVPKRGIGKSAIQVLYKHARSQNISLHEAIQQIIATDELRPSLKNVLNDLLKKFEKWRTEMNSMEHSEFCAMVLEESGYMEMWKRDKSPDSPGRLENLKELIGTIRNDFDSLPNFIEHVSLVMENTENTSTDKVNIMTLHSAKGLEFDTVFLPCWEEGSFPNQRSLDEGGEKSLEEERRLGYVGITRAKKQVYISFAVNRFIYNQWVSCIPSRFVSEVPEENMDQEESFLVNDQDNFSDQEDFSFSQEEDSRTSNPFAPINITPGKKSSIRYKHKDAELDSSKKVAKVGEEVFHDKFGYGKIRSVKNNKLEIIFQTGVKKVLKSFISFIKKK